MSDEIDESPYRWVLDGGVDTFVRRLTAIREGVESSDGDGEPARPAAAIRALHAFAMWRGTSDLVDCAEHFGREDAVTVLAMAALCRSIADAADLVVRQWTAERANGVETPLTDGIVHDVAGQRIALEVAAFVRTCWPADDGKLATKTLRVFARRRTNRDKAVLYIALRDEGCDDAAATLLRLSLDTLTEEAPRAHDTDPAEFHDLVGALYQLSPSERILEGWIESELRSAHQWTPTVGLVVDLVTSHRAGPDYLVEYVGRRLAEPALISVCERLCERSPDRCATVRAHIPAREQPDELATIVREWHKSKTLGRTTRELLADIVFPAHGAPRSLADLDELDKWLHTKGEAGPECGRLLWLVAAEDAAGRTGAEAATLLGKVRRRADRGRVAQRMAEQFAEGVHGGEAGAAKAFVDYFVGLRRANESAAAYSARRELGDPAGTGRTTDSNATAIAEIAVDLYRAKLADDAWDLLERCLENEQGMRPGDLATVVELLRGGPMPPENLRFLLRATVGRWTDTDRRDAAVAALRARGFETEATQIILSLR